MDPAVQPSLTGALDRLWNKFLPEMGERIAAIDTANHALSAGTLTIDQRTTANSAAHKLAGVLGTFGLTKGTVLAREAEVIYSGDQETDPSSLPQLIEIAEQLKSIVAGRT